MTTPAKLKWMVCGATASPDNPNGCQVSDTFNCTNRAGDTCYAVIDEVPTSADCLASLKWNDGNWTQECVGDGKKKLWAKLWGITGGESQWQATCDAKLSFIKPGDKVPTNTGDSLPISRIGNSGKCIVKPADGVYAELFIDADPACNYTKFEQNPTYQFCEGTDNVQFKQCTDWKNNNAEECKAAAPKGTRGWWKCGAGSSPGGAIGGGLAAAVCDRSDTFHCMWGQNCYAEVGRSYGANCDKTVFRDQAQACVGATKYTYRKCDDWAKGDPNSCKTKWDDQLRFYENRLKHTFSNMCVQSDTLNPIDGGAVTLGKCDDATGPLPRTRLEYDRAENRFNLMGRRDMCIAYSGTASTDLVFRPCNDTDNQKWTLAADGSIKSVGSGGTQCFDVPNNVANENVKLRAHTCTSTFNSQKYTYKMPT